MRKLIILCTAIICFVSLSVFSGCEMSGFNLKFDEMNTESVEETDTK